MNAHVHGRVTDLKVFLIRHSARALARISGAADHGLDIRLSTFAIDVVDPRRRRRIRLRRDHWVYAQDMVRHFDYYFDSVEPFRVEARDGAWEVVDFSTPRYHAIRGYPDHPVLCASLAEPFQTCLQYLDFARLQEGQTVLDLGCYSGLTSIAFSRAVGPAGTVVALEPDPQNHLVCRTNLDLARNRGVAANVRLLPLAVAGATGPLAFSSEGSMGSSTASIVGRRRGAVVQVDAIRLDDLAQRELLDRVDFVKMDVEGSEIDVIDTGEAFLRRYRPRLIIEPHVVDGVLCDRRIAERLGTYGYRCRTIEQVGVSLPLVTAEPEEAAP